jgi:pilus assembly protein CpaE
MSGLFSFGKDNAMHSEFMGFALDDDSLLALRGWAEKQGYPTATVVQGGPDMFAQLLETSSAPKVTLVDIDGQDDPVAMTKRLLNLCGGDCRIILIGSINDVGLYRKMHAAGAVDYLLKPVTGEMMNHAMSAALRGPAPNDKPAAKEARLIAFIGARGGVGTSTIALNVGWILAHERHRTVALFDLDLQYGTSSLALDLEPGRGLRDIVSSPNRVDSLMISSSLVAESDNFSVLGAEEAVDEVVQIDGGAIVALLKEMKNNFDAILIDMPRHTLALHKRALMAVQEIVIVSDLTLAGIRDTLRIKTALNGLGCSGHITIIASRTSATATGHIDRAVFEKGIQGKIDIVIAEDHTSFSAAANSGKSLAAAHPRSTAVKNLRELAGRLGNFEGHASQAKEQSFFAKLLGGPKKGHK